MFGRQPHRSPLDDALVEAVTDVVPVGSAAIAQAFDPTAKGWFLHVDPHRENACRFSVGAHARQLRFTLGHGTTFELYRVRHPRDLDVAIAIMDAIVAGRVSEYGSGGGFVKLDLGGRRGTFTGGQHSWWRPWPFTPKPHRYAAYVS